MTPEVVVTGVGAVTPLGTGADTVIERWRAGDTAFGDGLARCDDFKPQDFMSIKEARRTDRFTQLAVGAAEEALARAGWSDDIPYDPFRVSCVIGTGIGGHETLERSLASYGADGEVSPIAIPRLMANGAAATIAMRRKLHGPSVAVASACASGADAVAAGARLIRSGEADAAVVGGSESAISSFVQSAFAAMGAISKSDVCRPFDARRDGFVLAEGAAALVLERGDSARARGAASLGRLAGTGSSSDAYHITAPADDGKVAARAITNALADASIGAQDLLYVNAHGTGTSLNDRSETEALKRALGSAAGEVPVSSLKSSIGHSLGAAGAIEAVATLLALRSGVAPPTLGFEEREEGLDLDYVGGGEQPLREASNGWRYGISNSFGFGGHNVVLAFAVASA